MLANAPNWDGVKPCSAIEYNGVNYLAYCANQQVHLLAIESEICHKKIIQFPKFKKVRCITVHLRVQGPYLEVYASLDKNLIFKVTLDTQLVIQK